MARELPDFIDSYLLYTTNSEPPTSYHTWACLSIIAGALQRKVYLKWGFETLFPNMYVFLIGPSGRVRKGVAIGIAKDLLKSVSGISVAPESSSGREAMVMAMKRALSTFEDPSDGQIKYHCSLTAISEELSVFLGQGDIKYLANLTDFFDSKDDWSYETIGRGTDSLQGLCLNVLGATAPDWFQSMLPQEAVGGGFTSRCIFIVETQKKQTVPRHMLSFDEIALQQALTRDLERISQMSGQFHFDDAAEAMYVQWYIDEDKKLQDGTYAVSDSRFNGYCERRATHLRKLMIIISASRSDTLLINSTDFKRALEYLTNAERRMGETFGGLGKSRSSDATERIKEYIKSTGCSTRQQLTAKFYRDIDPQTLNTVEETLLHMQVINIRLLPNGDKFYTWIGA